MDECLAQIKKSVRIEADTQVKLKYLSATKTPIDISRFKVIRETGQESEVQSEIGDWVVKSTSEKPSERDASEAISWSVSQQNDLQETIKTKSVPDKHPPIQKSAPKCPAAPSFEFPPSKLLSTKMSVKVSNIENPCKFYAQTRKFLRSHDQFSKQCSSEAENAPAAQHLQIGSLYFVQKSDTWYRARIISEPKQSGPYEVVLVDYGNHEFIPAAK